MGYEWDIDKARSNLEKHNVDFADAALVLEDPLALTSEDPSSQAERRWVTIGIDPQGHVLVVVWSHRGSNIRLISARAATRREKRQYEELP